jgi:hypothetical protein
MLSKYMVSAELRAVKPLSLFLLLSDFIPFGESNRCHERLW